MDCWLLASGLRPDEANSNYLLRKTNNLKHMNHSDTEPGEKPRRIFPPQEILLFLSGIVFLSWMIGSGLLYLIFQSQGLDLTEGFGFFGKESPLEMRNFVRASLLINHLTMFLVPALFTGWLFYRSNWQYEVGTLPAPKWQPLGLGILLMAASFPVAQLLFQVNGWLVEQMPFLDGLVESEASTMGMMEGLLVMQSPWEMLFSLLVMAAVPAIGEEMVFRGFVQRLLGKWLGKPYVAILITSLIFGLVHFQVQRLLAIILMGIVLGLLFYWTRSLWVSIAAHFLFNGSQVVLAYFSQDKIEQMAAAEGETIPIAVSIFFLGAMVFIGKKLHGQHLKNFGSA